MRYHLNLLVIALGALPLLSSGATMNEKNLSVTIRCSDNPSCTFAGADMPIEISVKNTSSVAIGFPQEFLQKTGPAMTLIDTETGARQSLKTGLANHKLMKEFKQLAPGDSLTIKTIIKEREITSFRSQFVDLTAEIIVGARILIVDRQETVPFDSTETLRILGKDTLEREAQRRK